MVLVKSLRGFVKTIILKKIRFLFTKWVPKPGPIDKVMVREAIETGPETDGSRMFGYDSISRMALRRSQLARCPILFKRTEGEGLVKNIGVTNFDAHHLRIACASGIPIVSNQISHSLLTVVR